MLLLPLVLVCSANEPTAVLLVPLSLLEELTQTRRRSIHLPWFAAAICGGAWFLFIPVFIGALLQVQNPLDPRLLWHLPISFCVSGFIAVTHTFFLVELASQWGLFPVFFRDERADRTPNILTLSLRGRGIVWAVSASICPIASLLLLVLAPRSPATNAAWLAVFVGVIGIAFGIFTALMMSRLVAKPIDQQRTAADAVSRGNLAVDLSRAGARRADEFGRLLCEFDQMVRELRDKEKLRQTFGLHVGRRTAERILARDPGLSGVEEEITVMFVDMRSWTARASASPPAEIVEIMNDFFRVSVRAVEEEHRGMVNKYLGDGFMAIFGAGDSGSNHACDGVSAGCEILRAVKGLNDELATKERAPIQIGIGIHSGPADCGQRRFAATPGVHCNGQHGQHRLAHSRPNEDGWQTVARYRSRARSSRGLVRARGTTAAGSPRDRGASNDFCGTRVEALAAASRSRPLVINRLAPLAGRG